MSSIVRQETREASSKTGRQWFATTNWTVVHEAGQSESPRFQGALEQLCGTYWPALYSYLRRDGYSPADAQDLTQGFFLRLLRTNSLVGVSPVKGRFRTFLLASLKHYLCDERDRATARKRGGNEKILSIDGAEAEASFLQLPSDALSPEAAFDQHWALTVLEEAFERLRREYVRSGREEIFEILSPFLSNDAGAGDYTEPASKLGMSEQAVGVAVHRLRRRYRECVRFKVGQTLTRPEDVDEEMHYLFSLLS